MSDGVNRPTWESDCGTVKLWLGDCLEVMQSWPDGAVDAVVTDPPYGANRTASGIRKAAWRKATHYNSLEDSPEYISSHVIPCVKLAISKASAVAITPGFKCLQMYMPCDHIGGFYYQGQSTVTAWGAAWWQPILFYGTDPKTGRLGRDMFIGKSVHPTQRKWGHPCPKEFVSWMQLVERMSGYASLIADPFMGSGTTGVAAVRLGCGFWGVEIDPKYFENAKRRIQDELRAVDFLEPQQAKDRQAALFSD